MDHCERAPVVLHLDDDAHRHQGHRRDPQLRERENAGRIHVAERAPELRGKVVTKVTQRRCENVRRSQERDTHAVFR